MVSCGTFEKPNVITIAWTGIVNSDPAMTYISVRPERFSYGLVKETGEFVINLPTEKLARITDYCGVKSGRDIDKFSLAEITAERSSLVSAPIIAECPVNIECRVEQIISLGSHDMFLSKILAVDVDDKLLDAKGVLHLENAGLIVTSHGEYFSLGRKLGSFGYSVRKKKR